VHDRHDGRSVRATTKLLAQATAASAEEVSHEHVVPARAERTQEGPVLAEAVDAVAGALECPTELLTRARIAIEERDRARELDVDATLDLHTDNCLTTLLFEFSRATASSR
jgi:hypothetical protein